MPPVNPCTLAVDWLRSCHKGTWRFYEGRPDVLTRGRFFFVPHDQPHLDTEHWFSSCTWDLHVDRPADALGEDPSFGYPWTNGFRGFPLPPLTPLGTPAEFLQMEYPPLTLERTNYGGIDSRCWTQHGIHPAAAAICALENCNLQLAMSRCMELVYDQADVKLADFFHAWLGDDVSCTYIPVAGNFPAVELVLHPSLIICVVSGTDNFQQLALQCFDALQGPTNVGPFSTVPFWSNAAVWLNGQLVALMAPANVPILFVGHSYGAALSVILSARMKQFQPARDICLMTFGLPKFGDLRLRNLLDAINAVHLVNDGDIVPLVPPNIADLQPFENFIGDALTFLWGQWQGPRLVLALSEDGTTTPRPPLGLTTNDYFPLIVQAILGQPMPAVAAHQPTSYTNRLQRQCPLDDCGPIPPDAWKILFDGVYTIVAPQLEQSKIRFGDYGPRYPRGHVVWKGRFDRPRIHWLPEAAARADVLFETVASPATGKLNVLREAASRADVLLKNVPAPVPGPVHFLPIPSPTELTGGNVCTDPVLVTLGVWYSASVSSATPDVFALLTTSPIVGAKYTLSFGGVGDPTFFIIGQLTPCFITEESIGLWPTDDQVVSLPISFAGIDTSCLFELHTGSACTFWFRLDLVTP